MAHLPINLKIVGRNDDGIAVATESGHLFMVPAGMAPGSAEGETFCFDPSGMADAAWDGLRPAMTRALLNEIIGAPIAARGNDEKTA